MNSFSVLHRHSTLKQGNTFMVEKPNGNETVSGMEGVTPNLNVSTLKPQCGNIEGLLEVIGLIRSRVGPCGGQALSGASSPWTGEAVSTQQEWPQPGREPSPDAESEGSSIF